MSVNGDEAIRSSLVDGDFARVFNLAIGRLGYSAAGRNLEGSVAEVLLLRTAITPTQEADLFAYLRGKWLGQPCP